MKLRTTVKLSATNIYAFRYRAASHGQIAVYDRAPLVIPLDVNRKKL